MEYVSTPPTSVGSSKTCGKAPVQTIDIDRDVDEPIDSVIEAKIKKGLELTEASIANGKKVASNPSNPGKTKVERPKIRGYQYDLTGNASDCCTRYLELSGLKESDLKPAPTPCLDDTQIPEEDFLNPGYLSKNCAKICLLYTSDAADE